MLTVGEHRCSESDDGLRLEEVTKRYGETVALSDVSLTVRPGEFHGLVGPNGSGKSTLLWLLAGLVRPSTGTVERSLAAGAVGIGFQEPRAYPSLSVAENISVFGRLADASPTNDWTETLVDRLRLEPVRHRPVDDLSGGYRKRVDLALALIGRPQYLLLDEPLADVDERARRDIRTVLDAYLDDRPDRTVVVSTHRIDAFAGRFDRLTVLVDGQVRCDERVERIEETDSDTDVLEQYRAAVDG